MQGFSRINTIDEKDYLSPPGPHGQPCHNQVIKYVWIFSELLYSVLLVFLPFCEYHTVLISIIL